jgi:glutathionylspermidine synthase
MQRHTDGGHVALLSAPGFLEDQQVIFAFMRRLESCNIPCSVIQQPNALKWRTDGCCALRRTGQPIRAVVRFFQLEWLCRMKSASGWRELLQAQGIPVTNPTVSALSESKRFPLSFHNSSAFPTWQQLFPESRDPRAVGPTEWEDWVLKEAYSNAGDAVYICATYSNNDRRKLVERALREPLKWVAQRRFETLTVEAESGVLLPCVGVYVVDGKAAGAYVRLSVGPVTNGAAKEAPLLIEQSS